MKRHASLTLLCALVTTGCGQLTKSDYQRPMLSVPNNWQTAVNASEYVQRSEQWWNNFNDPVLSQLINSVLQSNNDLALAGLRLRQARLSAGLTDTNLTPDVTVSGSGTNTRNIAHGVPSTESYSSQISLSYELDLWGRLARQREQAQWQVEASEQDRLATALSTIGTTGQLYWQVANANRQITNVEHSNVLAQETLRLVQAKYAAGAVGMVDLVQARQTVLSRENQLKNLKLQRGQNCNAIALLINRPPGQYFCNGTPLALGKKIGIASSLPAQVIANRPDVQSAEKSLRASLAGLDVARLNFFPKLSLTSSLTAGSSLFSEWFENPTRAVGASLGLPFIEWNTAQLTEAQSRVTVQQAAVQFRTSVYSALKEVDDALSARETNRVQLENLEQALDLSREQLRIVEQQYDAGSVSYQTLLDAQNNVLSSENSLSDTQNSYLYSTMQYWLAIGGGVVQQSQEGL